METTKLSMLLNRMNRYQTIDNIEEQYKVRDLDEAIRELRRENNPPWTLKKSTLRVFKNVLEYPVAADHENIAYLETSKRTIYQNTARFMYTSLQQFYENPDDRNNLAEIWDNGTKYLGIRYKDLFPGSQKIDDASVLSKYNYGGDVTALAIDYVNYKEQEEQEDGDNASLKINITNNTGLANIDCAFTLVNDGQYKQKYFFIWVYFDSAPTSVDLKFGNNSSNYLYKNLTTQFSGQAFKDNDWNLLAIDLNTATVVGTITPTAFTYFSVVLHGAASGVYYIDTSYLKQWQLMDYWYYSNFNVKTNSAAVADQSFFMDDNETYSLDSSLVGDKDYADVVMYDAMLKSLVDAKDYNALNIVQPQRDMAWDKFIQKYPDMSPIIITHRVQFGTDYNQGRYGY